VPIFMTKSPACVAAMFGALGACRAFACLNRKLRLPQLEKIFEVVRPEVALVDPTGLPMLAEARDDSPLLGSRWWVVGEVLSPPQRKALERLSSKTTVVCWPVTGSASTVSNELNPSQPGACLFTSGSTGTPRGVLISRDDL